MLMKINIVSQIDGLSSEAGSKMGSGITPSTGTINPPPKFRI